LLAAILANFERVGKLKKTQPPFFKNPVFFSPKKLEEVCKFLEKTLEKVKGEYEDLYRAYLEGKSKGFVLVDMDKNLASKLISLYPVFLPEVVGGRRIIRYYKFPLESVAKALNLTLQDPIAKFLTKNFGRVLEVKSEDVGKVYIVESNFGVTQLRVSVIFVDNLTRGLYSKLKDKLNVWKTPIFVMTKEIEKGIEDFGSLIKIFKLLK
jgi:hypothetical protein